MGMTGYMGVAILILLGTFATYFKYTQGEMATLNQEIAVQTTKAAIAEANNLAMREQVAKQTAALSDLAVEQAEIRKESLRVADIFSKHNLALLASKKPVLIQNRINAGTKAVFDELEQVE
jgi:hypothetical protein